MRPSPNADAINKTQIMAVMIHIITVTGSISRNITPDAAAKVTFSVIRQPVAPYGQWR
jgi:hypothetical protein